MEINYKDNPLVSVIIPLHNHAQWIAECIQSIENQIYPNLEIIIIDDGSTDDPLRNIGEFIEDFCGHYYQGATDRGIPLFYQYLETANGPAFARNLGVKMASSETFAYAFLDSDDLYLPSKIEQSMNVLLAHDEVGAVYSDYFTFPANNPKTLIPNWKEPYSRNRLLQECIINCDSIVRASAFEKIGGFDEEMRVCEDYDFWIRLSEQYIISHIPEPLVKIRTGEHSSTSTINKEVWNKNWNKIREKMIQRAKNNNDNK